MKLELIVSQAVVQAVQSLYTVEVSLDSVQLQKTKKEFEGDLTVVIFPFVKAARKSPKDTAREIGQFLHDNQALIANFNVIKGFLNLSISQDYWVKQLNEMANQANYGSVQSAADAPLMMIEYSSPNTNKPLHLGHIRNNLLGFSISRIQAANGWKVVKTNIVNDRGIHICKSMLAWQLFGNGETPASSGLKGDHLVGKYYVIFDKEYRKEIKS